MAEDRPCWLFQHLSEMEFVRIELIHYECEIESVGKGSFGKSNGWGFAKTSLGRDFGGANGLRGGIVRMGCQNLGPWLSSRLLRRCMSSSQSMFVVAVVVVEGRGVFPRFAVDGLMAVHHGNVLCFQDGQARFRFDAGHDY